jgi:hypothetical protein
MEFGRDPKGIASDIGPSIRFLQAFVMNDRVSLVKNFIAAIRVHKLKKRVVLEDFFYAIESLDVELNRHLVIVLIHDVSLFELLHIDSFQV